MALGLISRRAMPFYTLDTLAVIIFTCEIFLGIGCTIVLILVPSFVGVVCTILLLVCGILGAVSSHTSNDMLALLRVFLALVLSSIVMFFVVPHVEELANTIIDEYLLPRMSIDANAPGSRDLRRTLHFGEDALLCVFIAMVCAGWILFSSVYWTHVRRGRVAERALRRFMKATPAVPYLGEPLLNSIDRVYERAISYIEAPAAGDEAAGRSSAADGTAVEEDTGTSAEEQASGEPSARSDGSDQAAGCAICLCPFEHGEAIRLLVCSHHFHKECIDRWVVSMQLAADCPLCKRQLMDDYL